MKNKGMPEHIKILYMKMTKKELYLWAIRHSHFMPSENSPCLIKEWYGYLMAKIYHVPSSKHLHHRHMFASVPRKYIYNAIKEILAKDGLTMGFKFENLPPLQYL